MLAYARCLRLCLRRLSLCLRVLLDLAAEQVFRRINARRRRRFLRPPQGESEHLLALSATELADKIRKRKVRKEGFFLLSRG